MTDSKFAQDIQAISDRIDLLIRQRDGLVRVIEKVIDLLEQPEDQADNAYDVLVAAQYDESLTGKAMEKP